jgi:dephospho-CoA kinase
MIKKLLPRSGQFIGITGNICSGKSFALKYFRKLGFKTVSMDCLVHQAMDTDVSIKQKISELFPKILKSGAICRATLADIVFADKQGLQKLESIIHPFTHSQIKSLSAGVKKHNARSIVIEVPLLFEKEREKYFDCIILITSSETTMLKRSLSRKNMNKERFYSILKNQMPLKEKIHKADCLIYNENKFYILHSLNKLIKHAGFKRGCFRY